MCRGNTSKKRSVQLKREDKDKTDKIMLFSMILRKENKLYGHRDMRKRSDTYPYLRNHYRRKFKALFKIVGNLLNRTIGSQDNWRRIFNKKRQNMYYQDFPNNFPSYLMQNN